MRNSPPLVIGQTIADKYRVEGVLGRGAMGVVLSARHLALEHLVAIKLLSTEAAQNDAVARSRFLREARLAARIRNEHVCRVLDTGALEDGTLFLVMEHLEGVDLAQELANRGRIDAVEAVQYLRQACEAVSVAHAAGVIHRDLKPANLFLTPQPGGSRLLKVLDFGVSKALVAVTGEAALTKTSSIVGSPMYMSPEQLYSPSDVDERSDVWALGTILYELIAGRPPFLGETIPALINGILNADPPRFAALRLSAPHGLESAIVRALSKSPASRYASAAEFGMALVPFVLDASDSTSGVFWNRSQKHEPAVQCLSQAQAQGSTDEDEAMVSPPQNPSRTIKARSSRRLLLTAGAIAVCAVALGVARHRASNVVQETGLQPGTTVGAREESAHRRLDVRGPTDAQPLRVAPPTIPDALKPETAGGSDEPPADELVEGSTSEVRSATSEVQAAPPRLQPTAPAARLKQHRTAGGWAAPAAPARVSDKPTLLDPLEIPGFGGRR